MSSNRKDAIKAALEALAARHGGRLTPEAVVSAAKRDKKGTLGRTFDWNLARAAERHWLDHARDLIARFVTVEVVHHAERITCPVYVRDPRQMTGQQGYVAITAEDLNSENARQIILAEIGRCETAIARGRAVSAVLDHRFPGTSEMFEDMLTRLVELRARLRRAA